MLLSASADRHARDAAYTCVHVSTEIKGVDPIIGATDAMHYVI